MLLEPKNPYQIFLCTSTWEYLILLRLGVKGQKQQFVRQALPSLIEIATTLARGPVLESKRLQDKKNTHFFLFEFFLRVMISSTGNSTRHLSCLYSEGEAIKPIYCVKLVAKYAFSLRAPSNIKHRLAGSGGDSRTGARGAGVPWLQQHSVS